LKDKLPRGLTPQKFYMGKQKSFTVIELLVVIAIIGLIASIVLVSLRGARQRAWIARGMHFSDSLRAGLADAIVGWWNLDEGSGNIAHDPWEGNDGTLLPAASPPDWVDGIVRGALSFDGSSDYVHIDISPSLNPSGGMNEITLEAWAKSTGNTGTWQVMVMKGKTDAEIDIMPETGEFRLGVTTSSRVVWNISAGITLNNWYHFVLTYDGSLIEGYVNGEFKESKPQTGNVRSSSSLYPNLIGQYTSSYWFRGLIDEVRIYNRSLTAFEIQKRYAEGLNKFKLVEK